MATLQNTTIPNAGTIGSVSDPDAISISSGGVVSTSAGLDVSSGTLTTSTAQKQAISSTAFASGTKMIFNQTAAPTGWTKDTSNNDDSALRVVTGTVGTGGTVAFTTAFASQAIAAHTLSATACTLGAHTLSADNTTVSEHSISADACTLSAHTLSVSSHTLSTSQIPSHTHNYCFECISGMGCGGNCGCSGEGQWCFRASCATGGSGSHSHSMGGSQTHASHTHAVSGGTHSAHTHAFSGSQTHASHTHALGGSQTHSNIDLAVKYVDIIVATKD